MGFLKYLFTGKSSGKKSSSSPSTPTYSPKPNKTGGRVYGTGMNKDVWVQHKKAEGKWESKKEYEKRTGKRGRKD